MTSQCQEQCQEDSVLATHLLWGQREPWVLAGESSGLALEATGKQEESSSKLLDLGWASQPPGNQKVILCPPARRIRETTETGC